MTESIKCAWSRQLGVEYFLIYRCTCSLPHLCNMDLGYTLLHRYSFNDGTASDSVGGTAYAGSLMAGATVTNNQANFTSSGQYVNLPSGLFGSYTAVSVEAWVTTGANSNIYPRIFQFGASGTSNTNSIVVFKSVYVCATWFSASLNSFYGSSVLFDGQTNVHLVMTISAGSNAKLYINGLLQGSIPAIVTTIPPPSTFYLGKSFDGATGLIGSVNEFRIWGGALSAADIATRYSQGPGENTSSHLFIRFFTFLQMITSNTIRFHSLRRVVRSGKVHHRLGIVRLCPCR